MIRASRTRSPPTRSSARGTSNSIVAIIESLAGGVGIRPQALPRTESSPAGIGSMAIGSMASRAANAQPTFTWTSRADVDQILDAGAPAHAKHTAPRLCELPVRQATTRFESAGKLPESRAQREDTVRNVLSNVASPNPFLARPTTP